MSRGESVLVFAGSTRESCPNRALAKNAAMAAAELRLDATLLDLRDYNLPLYEHDAELATGMPRNAMALRAQLKRHSAWLIVSPDHHNSTSTLLRNVIDWAACRAVGEPAGVCFKNKTVGLLSTHEHSSQPSRGLAHLREILVHLGASVGERELCVPVSAASFDLAGVLRDASARAELREFIGEIRSSQRPDDSLPRVTSFVGSLKAAVGRSFANSAG